MLQASAILLGSAISASCTQALLSGQTLEGAPENLALSDADMAKVARLAELIIPETDTPGAIEAGVPEFIQLIVADWYRPEERAIFLDGLQAIDVLSRDRTGDLFLDADQADQVAILQTLENEFLQNDAAAAGIEGDSPFFAKLKELTVVGYYTSEVGATQELIYMPVPGRFDGDARIDDLGRQWTL